MKSRIGSSRLVRAVAGPLWLTAGGTRWVGPVLFYGLWVMINAGTTPDQSIAEVGASRFFALVPTAIWLTHVINSVDDSAHREIHVAAAGSHLRVTAYRAAASVVAATGLGTMSLVMELPTSTHRHLLGGAETVIVAAAIIGVAIALPFSPPVTNQKGWAVGSGLIGFLALMYFPGVQASIRRLNAEDQSGAWFLLGGSVVFASVVLLWLRWWYRHRLI